MNQMNEPRGVANQSVTAMYSKNSRRAAKRKKNKANQGQQQQQNQTHPPSSTESIPFQHIQNRPQNEQPTQPPPKSRKVDKSAKLVENVYIPRYTFADFGGCEDQLLEACRLTVHLKHPEVYEHMKISPPKGFLLHGPPGCGKTMFAEVLAGELDINLMKINSTELIAGISGETEEKIRNVFKKAQEVAPCILLLDEIDTIASKRETAQREMERRIVTQLLNCLDDLNKFPPKPLKSNTDEPMESDAQVIPEPSLTSNRYVLVVGTTNRPDALDAALRRAGRFDHEIGLGIPDERSRKQILDITCRDVRIDPYLSIKELARLTPGYVGADIQALVREASMAAVHRIFSSVVDEVEGEYMEENGKTSKPSELDKTLALLKSEEEIQADQTANLFVSMADFQEALNIVVPSATREGFATVPDVTWEDIGALEEIRNELQWSILYPVQKQEDFQLLSVSTKPQGILLCGPPGCGKTLLAKAIANETGMNFISVKGPELLSMYVGESERAVRTVFQRARDSSPCVIFFDEIDALCAKRTAGENSAGVRVVNQLLTEMDGVEGRKQVFMIGATNRPDIVDPAILRPGRLDKILFVDFPDAKDRADILRKHTRNGQKPKIGGDVDFEELAKDSQLDYYTGADLAALIREASIAALKERLFKKSDVDSISLRHFEEAIEKIRPSVSESDRKKYDRLKELYLKKQLV